MSQRVNSVCEFKSLDGGEAKASFKRAFSMHYYTRNRVIYS